MRIAGTVALFAALASPLAPVRAQTLHQILPMGTAAMQSLTGCLDEARGVTLLAGWRNSQMETWEWDGAQFALRATEPPANLGPIAYDRVRQAAVQLRGDGSTCQWNGNAWLLVVPPGAGPTNGAVLGFDGREIVLFGRYAPGSSALSNETWTYDGTAWTQRSPAFSPPVNLTEPRVAFDARRGRLVLFFAFHSAVYEWNGDNWAIAGTPPWGLRTNQFVAFHAARGRVAIGAGSATIDPYQPMVPSNEVWEWDGTTFLQQTNLPVGFMGRRAALPMPDGDLLVGGEPTQPGWLAVRSVHPASVQAFGAGCAGSAGSARLDAEPWHWPWVGEHAVLRCSPVPTSLPVVLWAFGGSNQVDASGLLPRDLTPIGALGCAQLVAVDTWWLEPAVDGRSTTSIFVPEAPWLVGRSAFLQALVVDAANPAGFVLSNGAQATIGVR